MRCTNPTKGTYKGKFESAYIVGAIIGGLIAVLLIANVLTWQDKKLRQHNPVVAPTAEISQPSKRKDTE